MRSTLRKQQSPPPREADRLPARDEALSLLREQRVDGGVSDGAQSGASSWGMADLDLCHAADIELHEYSRKLEMEVYLSSRGG